MGVIHFLIILAVVAALIVIYLILREVIGAAKDAVEGLDIGEEVQDVAMWAGQGALDAAEIGTGFVKGAGRGIGDWFSDPIGATQRGWNFFFGSDEPKLRAEDFEEQGPPLPDDMDGFGNPR